MQTKYEHFTFKFVRLSTSGRTEIYDCISDSYGSLGDVKWYNPWRTYCFFPRKFTMFTTKQLSDIEDFIKQLGGKNNEKN